jgi:general stress protein YciG
MANNQADNLSDEARSMGGSNSGGNFKNDPQRASEAGRKGAQNQSTEAKQKGGKIGGSHSNSGGQ